MSISRAILLGSLVGFIVRGLLPVPNNVSSANVPASATERTLNPHGEFISRRIEVAIETNQAGFWIKATTVKTNGDGAADDKR